MQSNICTRRANFLFIRGYISSRKYISPLYLDILHSPSWPHTRIGKKRYLAMRRTILGEYPSATNLP
jgi:hypothetical protein